MIIIDREWHRNSNSGFDFGILVWNENDPYFLQLLPDELISWTLLGPKHCIGSRSNTGGLIKCPEMTVVRKGKHRCGPCSALDEYDPCLRCSGQFCNAAKDREEKCEQSDYVVYLAVFADKTLKVGVSIKSRILTRWVEQGADYGMILAELKGGKRARSLENLLAKTTIMKKGVHPTRKSSMISEELTYGEAQECVTPLIDLIEHSNYDFNFQIGKLTNLTKYYNLSEMEAKPISWIEKNTVIHGKQLFGQIVGMKGSLLVTKIKNAYTVANIHQLIGYSVNSEKEIKAVTQSGLLDYL